MEKSALSKALEAIALKKNELAKLDYSDAKYDEIEDALHDLEDDFHEEFGEVLEDALHDIHDDLCPDSDVLLPVSYTAVEYIEEGKNDEGDIMYKVTRDDGVFVEVDDYEGKETKLVLVPNPTRFWLTINGNFVEEVWREGK